MAAGKEDIAPELLRKVQEDYRKRCENDKELARIEALVESGKANGKDTDAYAVRAGELLAAALHDNVSGDVLPDGKMYFNIASRVLPPVLRENYELVAGMSTRIQQVLNDNAGLHMKALRPDLNEDRVKGLVNLAASADQYEDKRKELEADVVNFSQRISADGFHKNAEFQYTSGFNPKIRREAESGCCKWCQALEGTYDYYDVRDTGNDVWRRHRGCKCVVEYDPGTGRRQNAHTKTWSQADDHRKKIEDAERAMEERERGKINAVQEREHEYGVRYGEASLIADEKYINSEEYRAKFDAITDDQSVNDKICYYSRKAILDNNGSELESLYLLDKKSGELIASIDKDGDKIPKGIHYTEEFKEKRDAAKRAGVELISIHNHPEGYPPSIDDFSKKEEHGYSISLACGANGQVYQYENVNHIVFSKAQMDKIQDSIVMYSNFGMDIDRAHKEVYSPLGLEYSILKGGQNDE